jgi:hypothetical protein
VSEHTEHKGPQLVATRSTHGYETVQITWWTYRSDSSWGRRERRLSRPTGRMDQIISHQGSRGPGLGLNIMQKRSGLIGTEFGRILLN